MYLTKIATTLIRSVLLLTAAGLLVLSAGGLLLYHREGMHLMSVQTGSMIPAFRPGDAILSRYVTIRDLRPGEIVSYRSSLDSSEIITHRIIAIDPQSGWLTTKGDRNAHADGPFPPANLVGRAVAVIPNVGIVLNFIRRPLGLALVVYLPAILVISAELRRLHTHYQTPTYRLISYR